MYISFCGRGVPVLKKCRHLEHWIGVVQLGCTPRPGLSLSKNFIIMSSSAQLDPYVAQAQNDDVSTLQKIEGMYSYSEKSMLISYQVDLNKIVQGAQAGMLTTRASDGHLHSRAMTPVTREAQFMCCRVPVSCEYTASSKTQINLLFFANNSSPKFQEIRNDNHVNLSFFHTISSSTHWASISGIARVIDDRSVIKRYWSPGYVSSALTKVACSYRLPLSSIGSYFGDLGDGIHKGNEDDPRVAIIEVVPNEVRYWLPTSCPEAPPVQGKVTVSGELRTITKEEVSTLEVHL